MQKLKKTLLVIILLTMTIPLGAFDLYSNSQGLPPVSICGDNVIGPGEDCEPPRRPGCNNKCIFEDEICLPIDSARCGDGIVDPGEKCDDGNDDDDDGCTQLCSISYLPENNFNCRYNHDGMLLQQDICKNSNSPGKHAPPIIQVRRVDGMSLNIGPNVTFTNPDTGNNITLDGMTALTNLQIALNPFNYMSFEAAIQNLIFYNGAITNFTERYNHIYLDNVRGLDLRRINFGQSYSFQLFGGSNGMTAINFNCANLADAEFGYTSLNGAQFRAANLTGAMFANSTIGNGSLVGANFDGISDPPIYRTILTSAIFDKVDLMGTSFNYACLGGTMFTENIMGFTLNDMVCGGCPNFNGSCGPPQANHPALNAHVAGLMPALPNCAGAI